ncbi:MAG: alpha/beta fold hydrolase [Pseudomonadota bacterium]
MQNILFKTCLISLLCACAPFASAQSNTAPQQASVFLNRAEQQLIGQYSLERLDQITGKELDAFMASSTQPSTYRGQFSKARYPVKLYRLKYHSVIPELDNRPTVASGLVAIPETGQKNMPVVSYQHGTVFDRSYVPSNPDASMETRLMLAQFAAQGYIVVAADYFGRGVSDLPDSYLVKDSTRQAGFDMFLAAREFLKSQGLDYSQVFLSGWSQGGWSTMQYLKLLEQAGVPVTATAIASAPVDIAMTMNRWVNHPQPGDAVYLPGVVAIQLQSQEHYLQQLGLTESAIRAEYLAASRALYRNEMTWEEFFKRTPAKLSDFLRPEFRQSGVIGATPYWQTLERNQAYRWITRTPLRVYTGGHDEVTPRYVGGLPEKSQQLLGGAPVTTLDAGDQADHRGVFVFGLLDQKRWFDNLRAPR